jgi:hypothetical protein
MNTLRLRESYKIIKITIIGFESLSLVETKTKLNDRRFFMVYQIVSG